jgi:hypothetical protein
MALLPGKRGPMNDRQTTCALFRQRQTNASLGIYEFVRHEDCAILRTGSVPTEGWVHGQGPNPVRRMPQGSLPVPTRTCKATLHARVATCSCRVRSFLITNLFVFETLVHPLGPLCVRHVRDLQHCHGRIAPPIACVIGLEIACSYT